MTDPNDRHYFKADGVKYYFTDIADRVRAERPDLVGEHIFEQLNALGLRPAFDRASTPHMLPWSFTDTTGVLPDRGELTDLVKACQGEIGDEYRASEDEEDDQPGMQLTVGWDGKKDWSYQTGDNSFTGGAYGYQHWAVISVYRDSDAGDLAGDIHEQLEEVSA